MSSISESVSQRTTLGYLEEHYGFRLEPSYATMVTVTSMANDIASIRPGCLFVPQTGQETATDPQKMPLTRADLEEAIANGAYAMVLPEPMRALLPDDPVPVLYGELQAGRLGELASHIAANPSQTLAVFAVTGTDDAMIAQDVHELAQFLHMLGNPVATVSAAESQSLERVLDLQYPLDTLAMQQVLSVCLEDGAAAVIIAMDERTLQPEAMQAVQVDVIGCDGVTAPRETQQYVAAMCRHFGCPQTGKTQVVGRTEESDVMALQSNADQDQVRSLSLTIAMAMAAGIRKNSIKSVLRVTREMH